MTGRGSTIENVLRGIPQFQSESTDGHIYICNKDH